MYRPSDEALMQLGLYDYVWGDNAMLQNYLSRLSQEEQRQFQAEENAKNRQAQREYNEYLKEYDTLQANKEKKLELASLYKDYNNAQGEQERALIKSRIQNLESELGYADDVKGSMTAAYEADKLAKQKAEVVEAARQRRVMEGKAKYLAELSKAKTLNEKLNMLHKLTSSKKEDTDSLLNEYNFNITDWTDDDKKELYNKVLNTETQQEANKGAVKSAIASGVAEDVKTAKAEKEEAAKLHEQVLAGKKLFGQKKALHDRYYPSK